jgi:hypothetical protein
LVVLLCLALVAGPACHDSEQSGSQPSNANVKDMVKGLQAKPTGGMDARPIIAQQLGDMGPAAKEALPALRKLTTDKDEKTREAAKQAISKIGGK